eukprot:Rhum_TRINITY_DN15261_c9_g1::Rhum_TRINITY_DN15261_c9_g1_i1::g.146737::m.146737/K12840/RBM17, SPF45; splicing factor 45
MSDATQDHVLQSVVSSMARRNSAMHNASQVPLAIQGPTEAESVKQNTLVVYGSTGRRLNFKPEELQKAPEQFEGNAKALKEWGKIIPVYTRKALCESHFQNMSLEQIRNVMERAVVNAIEREKADRQRKQRARNKKKLEDRATEVIMLRNIVGRNCLDDATKEEIIHEMDNFGTVLFATAHEVEDPACSDEEAVRIFVRYSSKEEARNAHKSLHLRVFDGRYIAASFFPLQRLLSRALAPEPATEDKLPAKCRERAALPPPPGPPPASDPRQPAANGSAAPGAAGFGGSGEAPEAVMMDVDAPPAALKRPEKLLPPYIQALIDVIAAAAKGEEITDELIFKADPIAEKEAAAKAGAEAAKQKEAELRAQEEAKVQEQLAAAAAMAAELTQHLLSQKAKKGNQEGATTTEDVEGID